MIKLGCVIRGVRDGSLCRHYELYLLVLVAVNSNGPCMWSYILKLFAQERPNIQYDVFLLNPYTAF